MVGEMILAFFAAYGLFSTIWAMLGWLLPDGRGCALVCIGLPDEGILSRIRWLRGTGLLRVPVICVAEEEDGRDDLEICSREQLLSRLEWEKRRFDGTGNGDYTGNHQRRGISEL